MRVHSAAAAIAIAIAWIGTGCHRDRDRGESPPRPSRPSSEAQGIPSWNGDWSSTPQLPDVVALYESLQPLEVGALRSGLLVCRIDVKPNNATRDVFSDPDLAMELSAGSTWIATVYGKSDSWTATVAVAAVDLAPGADVRATVWDRDDFSDGEHIADLAGRFTGTFPITLAAPAATIECRAVPASVLADRTAAALRVTDTALDALAAGPGVDFVSNRARPKKLLDAARRAIAAAAGHAGWRADRVRERVAREQELERDWQRRVRAAGDELVAKLPAPGALVPLDGAQLSVGGKLDCDPSSIAREVARAFPGQAPVSVACLLRVDLTPVAEATIFPWDLNNRKVKLLARDGEDFAASESWLELDGALLTEWPQRLTPGMRISLVFLTGDSVAQKLPELATISIRKARAAVRIR